MPDHPPAILTTQRRWVLRLGPFRLAHSSRTQRLAAPAAIRWPLAGALVGGTATLAALLVYAETGAAARVGYVVRQPMPAPPAAATRVERPRARHRPAPAVVRAATAPAADEDAPDPGGRALRAAEAAAWRTGDAQDWQEGATRGIVVPGPLEPGDGIACRSLSRLTRRDGAPDAVLQWRRCFAAAG